MSTMTRPTPARSPARPRLKAMSRVRSVYGLLPRLPVVSQHSGAGPMSTDPDPNPTDRDEEIRRDMAQALAVVM